MVTTTTRRLSDFELKCLLKPSFLGWSWARRTAKQDAAQGEVEVLDFQVQRAWKLISCAGPPCCPNSWLLQVDADQFVYVQSWKWLAEAAEDTFPGSHVIVERSPLSGTVWSAQASGPTVPTPPTTDEMMLSWTHDGECVVLARSDMEAEFVVAAGLGPAPGIGDQD